MEATLPFMSDAFVLPASLIPANDQARLGALYRYELLDTPPETFFDRITRFASRLLNTPSAFISLVDKDRVWYKSNFSSLDVPCVDRQDSLCSYTIVNDADLTVFEDTHLIPELLSSPFVSAPGGIRFYAGAPLVTHDGFNIGTVCVIDAVPRTITDEERTILKDLAVLVIDQIELRAIARRATRKHDELHTALSESIAPPLTEQYQLLQESKNAPESSYILDKALSINESVIDQVQHLLKESESEEDEISLQLKPVAISSLCSAIASEYESLAQAKKQELYFTVASRRELPVDADLLREAITNLVSTAIKYTPSGCAIGLDIYESDHIFKIEVSSEVSVLKPEDLRKIFLKYARLSAETTNGESSSGLELARAKAIIERHNGKLSALPEGKAGGFKFMIAFSLA